MMTTVDISSRLRRAITQNDFALIIRILKNNPSYVQNPDFADKSNTSLHLAARHGLLQVAEHLISLGHDRTGPSTRDSVYFYSTSNLGPSHNTDGHTALHLAASHSHTPVVLLLSTTFPSTVNIHDNAGMTALHLAARAHPSPSAFTSTPATKISTKPPEDTSTIETLLRHGADVGALDHKGNTCLHYATAWGNLKAVRVLIQAGADPLCQNKEGWTPEYYSITVQAEVYFRNLVAEWEKLRAVENKMLNQQVKEKEKEQQERRAGGGGSGGGGGGGGGKGGGGVRLVQPADNPPPQPTPTRPLQQEEEEDPREQDWEREMENARNRADSGGSSLTTRTGSGLGLQLGNAESWKS